MLGDFRAVRTATDIAAARNTPAPGGVARALAGSVEPLDRPPQRKLPMMNPETSSLHRSPPEIELTAAPPDFCLSASYRPYICPSQNCSYLRPHDVDIQQHRLFFKLPEYVRDHAAAQLLANA